MYTLLCTSYNRALLILGNLLSVGRLQSEPPYWVLFPGQRAYNRVSKLTLFVVSLNRKRFTAIRWNTLLITGSKSTQLDPKQEKNGDKTTLRVISLILARPFKEESSRFKAIMNCKLSSLLINVKVYVLFVFGALFIQPPRLSNINSAHFAHWLSL